MTEDLRRPVLLTGGNPQIAKVEGDAPVQAYIAAMPGWKRAVGEKIDALVVAALPTVAKAVKWNTPLYGFGDGTWFLSFHAMTRYIKVGFFAGAELDPPPPVASEAAGAGVGLARREGRAGRSARSTGADSARAGVVCCATGAGAVTTGAGAGGAEGAVRDSVTVTGGGAARPGGSTSMV